MLPLTAFYGSYIDRWKSIEQKIYLILQFPLLSWVGKTIFDII